MELTILVGTMTGTAELCAEDIADALAEAGHEAEIVQMDGLDAGIFEAGRTWLVCTSTYGQGDVPDNAMGLYDDLTKSRPDLSGVRYGVVALGDRTYNATFTHGGQRFDDILQELGATRLGEVFRHDASSGTLAEDEATAWAREWITVAAAGAGIAA